MDVSNLQENYPTLELFFEEHGYSFSQKGWLKRCIKLVLRQGASFKIRSYEQLYLQEIKRCGYDKNAPVCLRLKSVLGAIKQFDLEGIFPQRKKRKGFMTIPPIIDQIDGEFRSIIDHYKIAAKTQGKRDETIYAESRAAVRFFAHLLLSGITSIVRATERSVLAFFFDGKKIIRTKDYKDKIVPVLQAARGFCKEEDIDELLSYFPSLKKRHSNYPYLTMEEAERLRIVLFEEHSSIQLLDKAMATIAYYTGLRGTDITSLTLNNIDWKECSIRLTQSKTGKELNLPLTPIVGNAIWAYLSKERPKSKEKYVFVTSGKPYKRITNLWWHLKNVFDEAGIRTDERRTGVRIFRHHLATSLLSKETPSPIISSILGHSSPESINPYVDADLIHLKKCSLSIAEYPIAREVFEL